MIEPYKNLLKKKKQSCSFVHWRRILNFGFGLLWRSDGAHSVILKEIEVPLWDDAKCQLALRSQFGPNFVLPPTSICAGAEGRDACDVSIFLDFLSIFFWVLILFTATSWTTQISPNWNRRLGEKSSPPIKGFTGFYWVLLAFTRFNLVLLGFTRFYWIILGFTGFQSDLLGFTGFYQV